MMKRERREGDREDGGREGEREEGTAQLTDR